MMKSHNTQHMNVLVQLDIEQTLRSTDLLSRDLRFKGHGKRVKNQYGPNKSSFQPTVPSNSTAAAAFSLLRKYSSDSE